MDGEAYEGVFAQGFAPDCLLHFRFFPGFFTDSCVLPYPCWCVRERNTIVIHFSFILQQNFSHLQTSYMRMKQCSALVWTLHEGILHLQSDLTLLLMKGLCCKIAFKAVSLLNQCPPKESWDRRFPFVLLNKPKSFIFVVSYWGN